MVRWAALIAICLAGTGTGAAIAEPCTGKGVELQVLGSGGPEMQTKRASSGYLVWRDGKARVLVDSGGGSALRFGEAGAEMRDLDVVLFTHLHADHSADFPALVKSSFFEDRDRPLPVFGPAGNRYFPATTVFVRAMLGGDKGAYRYLSGFLEQGSASYIIQPHDVAPKDRAIEQVYSASGVAISATTVQHGAVPALAWRVAVGDAVIVFSGDTNGENGNLEKLGAGAGLFVAHNAVPEGAVGIERQLHMPPSVIGRIAAEAGVGGVVLSHRMLRTLGKETETQQSVAARYKGPIQFANDLDCYSIIR